MAVYKIPQDVEAEDRLLWMFTPRQSIFMGIAALCGFMTFILYRVSPILVVLPVPIGLIFAFLGIFGAMRKSSQPLETYLAARMRFYFKPRIRIWNPDGLLEAVNITAPKRTNVDYTNGMTENQVQNRLSQLAGIMDTRGWSAKNVSVQGTPMQTISQSDRLVAPPITPLEPSEIHESDDMLYNYNPVALQFNDMSQHMTKDVRQGAIAQMQQMAPAQQAQVDEPDPMAGFTTTAPQPAAAAGSPNYDPYPNNMRQTVLQPQSEAKNTSVSTMTQIPQTDIMRLSQNNDLSVSTIAQQAESASSNQQPNAG